MRVGRKNDPSFRIIVQDHRRSPKKTRGVSEFVGSYDARKGTPIINAERVKYWIGQGAQPSDTVHNLLVDAKIVSEKKVNAHNKKTKVVKEVPKVEPKKTAPVAEVKAAESTPVVEAPVPEEVVAAPEAQKAEVVSPEEVAPAPEVVPEAPEAEVKPDEATPAA